MLPAQALYVTKVLVEATRAVLICCLQTYHWNEKRKIEEYYSVLAKLQQQSGSPEAEE